jgi:hypothetical protein
MKVILLTGPQGSGNHLWSKVFTTWADKEYWVGHKDEPHSNLWEDMDSWRTHKFSGDTVISISVPYAVRGNTKFPDITGWKEIMVNRDIDHKICVTTRDGYINFLQNERVRPENNYKEAVEYIKGLEVDCYLSTETLLQYQWKYIEQISKQLDFPVPYKTIDFTQSFNEKYVHYVETFHLDDTVRRVSGIKERGPFI